MRKVFVRAVFLVTLFLLVGCQSKEVSVVDRDGNEVMISHKMERIISTAPSNTEVLIGLGLADQLIAVDKYSPLEELMKDIPLIDFRNPDAEVIIGLEPDLLIVSSHNKSGADDPFAVIKEAGISVVYIPSASSLEGIYEDIEFMAMITDTKEKGETMVQEMKAEVEVIKKISGTITDKKSVYLEIAPAPNIFTTGKGTFQDEMITLIGADNIFGDEDGWMSPSAEAIVSKNPDVILTNVSYVEESVNEIINRDGFGEINAVLNDNVYLIDTNASSRASQHVIKSIKEMAKAVYPEYYE